MTHEFKPYADMLDYCVEELPETGDTCNRLAEDPIHESDVVDPETRWAAFGQCGECNEPDRIMSQVAGLCVTCDAKLRSE